MAYVKYMVSTNWNIVVLVAYWCVPNHSRIQVNKTTIFIMFMILWVWHSGRHRQNRMSMLHDAHGFSVGDLNSRDGCDDLTETTYMSPRFWLFAQFFGGSLQGADWGWNILHYFSLTHLMSGLDSQNSSKQASHPFLSKGPLRACYSQGIQASYSSWLTPERTFQEAKGTSCCLGPSLSIISATVPGLALLQWEETPLDEKSDITHRQEELFGVIFRD